MVQELVRDFSLSSPGLADLTNRLSALFNAISVRRIFIFLPLDSGCSNNAARLFSSYVTNSRAMVISAILSAVEVSPAVALSGKFARFSIKSLFIVASVLVMLVTILLSKQEKKRDIMMTMMIFRKRKSRHC